VRQYNIRYTDVECVLSLNGPNIGCDVLCSCNHHRAQAYPCSTISGVSAILTSLTYHRAFYGSVMELSWSVDSKLKTLANFGGRLSTQMQ